jgi:hypothetical protein
MVASLNADCALLNSGTLRSDARHPAGKFLLRVGKLYLFVNKSHNFGIFYVEGWGGGGGGGLEVTGLLEHKVRKI